MLGHVTISDFYVMEGPQPNHMKIGEALSNLGGSGFKGDQFRDLVLQAMCGDKNPDKCPDNAKAQAYNLVADAFNKLGSDVTAESLFAELGISSQTDSLD